MPISTNFKTGGKYFPTVKQRKAYQKKLLLKDLNILGIVEFANEILGVSLHKNQAKWLRESTDDSYEMNILVPSYRWGKTFAIAIKHIWHCYYKIGIWDKQARKLKDYNTLNLSPKLRQVQACYKYIWQILNEELWWEEPLKHGAREWRKNKLHPDIKGFIKSPTKQPIAKLMSQTPIIFKNNSVFNCAPTGGDLAAGIAGAEFPYISYDECGLSGHLEEELGTRIMSRQMGCGINIDLVGTPDSDSESFPYYQGLVSDGLELKNDWHVLIGVYDDNKFIPKKTRDKFKQAILKSNPDSYAQTIEGKFITGGSHLIPLTNIEKMFKKNTRLFKNGFEGHQYVIGCDWAASKEHTCFVCIDYTERPYKVVDFFRCRGNDLTTDEQIAVLIEMKGKFQDADIITDSNGLGGAIIEQRLQEYDAVGFKFAVGDKAKLILALKLALCHTNEDGTEETIIECPDSDSTSVLKKELMMYTEKDQRNRRKDTVMALALALYFIQTQEEDNLEITDYDILGNYSQQGGEYGNSIFGQSSGQGIWD